MNVSLKPKKPQTVKTWLVSQTVDRLDAELILSHVLKCERTWLVTHDDYELPDDSLKRADELAARRGKHEPLAYITGRREFYGRQFTVTPDVLIPRPETEQLVEAVKGLAGHSILDVGTGSGAIAITLALDLPHAKVTATDISPPALKIARQNAKTLGANVKLVESDLLKNISDSFDIIVANLPYVAHDWQVSPSTKYEPALALFANDAGEYLLKKLVLEAPGNLNSGGFLALEMDPRQVENIAHFAVKNRHFTVLKKAPFFAILQMK